MFDGIAQKYDLLNTIASLGFDRRWRRKAVGELKLGDGDTLLDLAAGTLDISIAASKKYPGIRIIAADPSKEMLKVGTPKLRPLGHGKNICTIASTGEALPLAPQSIQGAIIAFGIRNFQNRPLALTQLHHALVPGGRLIILELSIPRRGPLAPLASFHVQTIIPLLGKWLSSGAEYEYLPQSMKKFPSPNDFEAELRTARFSVVRTESFMAGACHLFVCERPKESFR